jgi:hypothetical protein
MVLIYYIFSVQCIVLNEIDLEMCLKKSVSRKFKKDRLQEPKR